MNKKRSFAQICAMSTVCMMLSVAYAGTAPANPTYVFKKPLPTLVVTGSPTGPVDPGPNLTPNLFYSTDALTYGAIQVGSSSTKSFLITNIGNGPATLNPGISLRNGAGVFGGLQTNCSSTLLPGANCSVSLTFSPLDAQIYTSFIDIISSNASAKVINLSGEGIGQAIANLIAASGSSSNFGSVNVGANKSETFIFSNTGNVTDKGVYASLIGSNLSFSANSCGIAGSAINLAAGANCSMTVVYAPTATGVLSGGLSINSTATGQKTLSFAGEAVAATLDLSTNSINYDSVSIGESSTKSFLIFNSGSAALTFTEPPFLKVGSSTTFGNLLTDCGTSLSIGGSCTVNVKFTPNAVGTFSGVVDIATDNAGSGSVSLSGLGSGQAIANLTFNANNSGDFGVVQVGSTKTSLLTFQNTGNIPATGVKAILTGTDLSLISNSCGVNGGEITLAPNATCQVGVTFAPKAFITLSNASLAIQSSATTGVNTVSFTGSGDGAAVPELVAANGSSTNFGNVQVGSSKSQTFTFSNTGNLAATGVYASVDGPGISIASNNCGTQASPISVVAGGSCNVVVSWSPSVGGSMAAANITVGGKSLNLSGNATQTTMNIQDNAGAALSGLNFGTINADATKVIRLANSSVSPAALNVSNVVSNSAPYSVFGVGNALGGATCTSATNMSIPAGGSCDVSVKMSSSTNGTFNSGSITVTSNAQVSSPISGATSVNIPITGTVYIDQYSSGTTAYLTFEAPNGTSTFTDQSPVAPAITVNGVTASNSYAAAGATSGYFSGSSSIQYASSANYDVTQGDFTIEANIKATAMNTNNYIAVQRAVGSSTVGWNWRFTSTGAVQFWYTGGTVFTSDPGVVVLNTPVKLAIQRVGNVFKLFKDGTLIATSTTIANGTSSNTALYVGVAEDGTSKFTGYMDEFRLTKGFARYDGTIPDPYAANVNALMNFSANTNVLGNGGHTATLVSPAALQAVGNPFNGTNSLNLATNGYVDLSNSVTLGTSDFTYETWVKFTGLLNYKDGNNRYVGYMLGSTTTTTGKLEIFFNAGASPGLPTSITVGVSGTGSYATTANFSFQSNTWHHVAATRQGNNLRIFVDGMVRTQNTGFSVNLPGNNPRIGGQAIVGYYGQMPAYLSNFRLTTGVARYTGTMYTLPREPFPAP